MPNEQSWIDYMKANLVASKPIKQGLVYDILERLNVILDTFTESNELGTVPTARSVPDITQFAPLLATSDSNSAQIALNIGEYGIWKNVFYQAIKPININDTLIINDNIAPISNGTLNSLAAIQATTPNILILGSELFGAASFIQQARLAAHANIINGTITYGSCSDIESRSTNHMNDFTGTKLITALISGDFSTQVASYNAMTSTFQNYVVNYLNLGVNNSVWPQVDELWFGYGLYDFNGSVNLGSQFKTDYESTVDSILYSKRNSDFTLKLLTPSYAYWNFATNPGGAEDKIIADTLLPEYVELIKEIGKKYHVPVVDLYNNFGINKYNYALYLTEASHIYCRYKTNILSKVVNAIVQAR